MFLECVVVSKGAKGNKNTLNPEHQQLAVLQVCCLLRAVCAEPCLPRISCESAHDYPKLAPWD